MSRKKDAILIKETLKTFVRAWENGDPNLMDHCMNEEIFSYFSIFGNCYTKTQLKEALFMTKKEYVHMQVENEVCQIQGNKAKQYAVLIGAVAETRNDCISQICFGGSFCNTLIFQEGKWLLETVRFELQVDSAVEEEVLTEEGLIRCKPGTGDRGLIESWKQVNDRIGLFMDPLPEQGRHTITGELDAPWYGISSENQACEDAVQIKDLFAKYCFAMDFDTFLLLKDVFAEELEYVSCQAGTLNKHDAMVYLKLIRQASPRSFHAGRFTKLQIQGDHAKCEVNRFLPECMCVSREPDGNFTEMGPWGQYTFEAVKTDNTWKISMMGYNPGFKEV